MSPKQPTPLYLTWTDERVLLGTPNFWLMIQIIYNSKWAACMLFLPCVFGQTLASIRVHEQGKICFSKREYLLTGKSMALLQNLRYFQSDSPIFHRLQ